MDSLRRSIIKSCTYRVSGFFVTAGVTYLITGRATVAAAIGLADTVVKVGSYFAHERLWERINYGKRTTDFEI